MNQKEFYFYLLAWCKYDESGTIDSVYVMFKEVSRVHRLLLEL